MKIDERKNMAKDRKRKAGLIQWQQFSGMLLFLVVNSVYKSNKDDQLIQIFYMISYAVFLVLTIITFTNIMMLFPDKEDKNNDQNYMRNNHIILHRNSGWSGTDEKGAKMNEERVMFHENVVEEIRHNREKNDQALDMFIERRDMTGMPVELFWDWLEELRKFRKAESKADD